jgi:hypothetical protein
MTLLSESSMQDRLTKNLVTFERFAPNVYHSLLAALNAPDAQHPGGVRITVGPAGELDLVVGDRSLHGGDAVGHASAQVEEFLADPYRLWSQPPRHNIDPCVTMTNAILDRLYGRFGPLDSDTPLPLVEDGCGILVVFGTGLGFHLPLLLDATRCQTLIIVEEHAEILLQSLFFVDWFEIFDQMKGRISFYVSQHPDKDNQHLLFNLRGDDYALVEGACVFRSHVSPLLDRAYQLFIERWHLMKTPLGTFEEQLILIDQTYRNLTIHGWPVIDRLTPRISRVPAVIVGAGPSLDESLPVLREIQDRVVIFSCGTALAALLRGGVRPDFHCELERVDLAYDAVGKMSVEHDLSGITLIASSAVWPELPTLFERGMFYVRDGQSFSLIRGDLGEIPMTGPTVTNLGVVAANMLGFHNIYLFGVDLGSRSPKKHHSGATLYHTDKKFGELYNRIYGDMTIPQPANLGGQAWTMSVLLWTQLMMVYAAHFYPFEATVNCSDGVRIEGFTPLPPEGLSLKTTPADKRSAIDDAVERNPILQSYNPPSASTVAALFPTLADWYAGLLGIIDDSSAKAAGFVELYQNVIEHCRLCRHDPSTQWIEVMARGTLMCEFQSGYYVHCRRGGAARTEFMEWFHNDLRELVITLRGLALDFHQGLVERLAQSS